MKQKTKNIRTLIPLLLSLAMIAIVLFDKSSVSDFSISVPATNLSSAESVSSSEETDSTTAATVTEVTTTVAQTTAVLTTVAPPKPSSDGVRYVAFTFDDGPNITITNDMLDLFEKYNGKATFFTVGTNVELYPDIAKRIVSSGSEIASHSYAHKHYDKMSAAEIKADLSKSCKAIKDATGVEPKLLRVPYGAFNDTVLSTVGKPIVLWSLDTNDWRYKIRTKDNRTKAEIERDKKIIINSIWSSLNDGDIILMHDLNKMTLDVCKEVIPKLSEDGWKMVTVSELAEIREIKLENGVVYRTQFEVKS